jgi:uncharacterized protein
MRILKNGKNLPFEKSGYKKSNDLAEPVFEVQKLTGLEFWFTPYLKESSYLIPLKPPPRYKMVLVTIPIISFMLLTLVPQMRVLTEMLLIPYAIRLVIAITITVLLMTYVIMPLITRLLKS